MTDKRTRILTAVVFTAVVILSLLIAVKNSTSHTKNAEIRQLAITESESFAGLNPLEKSIILAFRELAVPDSAVNSRYIEESESREISVDVPLGKPMEEVISIIQAAARKTTYTIEDSYYSAKKDYARMQFGSTKEAEKMVVLKLQRSEDGYFKQNLSIFLIITGLDTVSAQTRLRYLTFDGTLSYEIPAWSDQLDSAAVVLNRYKLPLIVRIPLESKGRTVSNDYTLRIDDSRGSIETKINELHRRVPSAAALSSEGGDLFLDTRGSSSNLFEILKDEKLGFIDRRTGTTDRAQQSANHCRIDYIRNIKELSGETVDDYTQELRRVSLSARREVVLLAEASPQLIASLEKNSRYFEKTGVTFKGITELSIK